jgi:hypothetical protein
VAVRMKIQDWMAPEATAAKIKNNGRMLMCTCTMHKTTGTMQGKSSMPVRNSAGYSSHPSQAGPSKVTRTHIRPTTTTLAILRRYKYPRVHRTYQTMQTCFRSILLLHNPSKKDSNRAPHQTHQVFQMPFVGKKQMMCHLL